MSYDLNAEDGNPVGKATAIFTDSDWNLLSGDVMVFMDTTGGGLGPPPTLDVTALTCTANGAAPAVVGGSGRGPGVVGVTAFSGSPPNPPIGTGKNAGVYGAALNQTDAGVMGEAGYHGVVGLADMHGVEGSAKNAVFPAYLSVMPAGVLGSGYIVGEKGTEVPGVLGISSNGVGVIGESDRAAGVAGQSQNGDGVSGYSYRGIGVHGEGHGDTASVGVKGDSEFGAGVEGGSTAGIGVVGWTPGSKNKWVGQAGAFFGPVWVFGPFTVMGAKHAAVPHPDGTHRVLYSLESPESWFEDFGEGTLVDGKAEVKIDADFATVVKADGYHIFLTPYGDSRGLYVTNRSAAGFEVREQQGGKNNLRFSYRIVAKRKDIDGERLAKIALPKAPAIEPKPIWKSSRQPEIR